MKKISKQKELRESQEELKEKNKLQFCTVKNPSNVDEKTISVVIPVYNETHSPYLLELMDSLRDQSLDKSHYQVIFVDNNSTDGFKALFKKYVRNNKLNNFKYLFQSQPGVTNARKMGYKHVIVNYSRNHLIVSCDADSIISSDYLKTYYDKNFEIRSKINYCPIQEKIKYYDSSMFYLGGTPDYNYDQIPDKLENIKKLLKYKHKLDNYLMTLTKVPKFEGGDAAISVELYMTMQLKPLYYIEDKKIYSTPSDDWNYCFDIMYEKNLLPIVCDTSKVSKINCRKFINNISDILDNNLYTEGWEDLNANVKRDEDIVDLTDEDFIRLKYKITRSSLIYHYYIKQYILQHKYRKVYVRIFDLYGHSKYDDIQNYFGPAVFCYLMYGEKLWNDIPGDIIDIPWKQLDIVTELQKQISYDYDNVYHQIMFKLSKSDEIFKYFVEI